MPDTTHHHSPAPARLQNLAAVLADALAIWAGRDDSRPQPGVRQAANTAVDTMDAMMHELYIARQRLADEMRESDDAAMERSARLLARPAGRRLCAHADLDGAGMHLLEPAETCPRLAPRAAGAR
jgi:hypothetical protein